MSSSHATQPQVAARLGVARHVVVDIDLRTFGGSALTDDLEVPKGRSPDSMTDAIPVTYVPARKSKGASGSRSTRR